MVHSHTERKQFVFVLIISTLQRQKLIRFKKALKQVIRNTVIDKYFCILICIMKKAHRYTRILIDEIREVCYNADNKNSRDTIKYERWKMKREAKDKLGLEDT